MNWILVTGTRCYARLLWSNGKHRTFSPIIKKFQPQLSKKIRFRSFHLTEHTLLKIKTCFRVNLTNWVLKNGISHLHVKWHMHMHAQTCKNMYMSIRAYFHIMRTYGDTIDDYFVDLVKFLLFVGRRLQEVKGGDPGPALAKSLNPLSTLLSGLIGTSRLLQ